MSDEASWRSSGRGRDRPCRRVSRLGTASYGVAATGRRGAGVDRGPHQLDPRVRGRRAGDLGAGDGHARAGR